MTVPGIQTVDPLIENGMRFGSLVRIDDPAMCDRYNRILRQFGLRPVATVPFHVDVAGFSLEVAEALGDLDYLDPPGASRRFIVVTRRQAEAPLIHSTFSCEKGMMRHFHLVNEGIIARVTLRSALYGEIENHTYGLDDVRTVLRLRRVQFECHALDGFFEKQKELRDRIVRFRGDPLALSATDEIDRMIELAASVGDVRTSDSEIRQDVVEWPSYFATTLFGGASFLDVGTDEPVIVGDPERLVGVPPECLVLDYAKPNGIVAYLERKGYLDHLDVGWLKASGFVDHRIQMAAADFLVDRVEDTDLDLLANPRAIENAISANFAAVRTDETFAFLSEVRSIVAHGDRKALEEFDREARPAHRALLRRATPHEAAAPEVNRILARICRLDPVTLFALDKPEFYRIHAGASPARARFMTTSVRAAYMPDAARPDKKIDLKNRFFGDGWKD